MASLHFKAYKNGSVLITAWFESTETVKVLDVGAVNLFPVLQAKQVKTGEDYKTHGIPSI